VFEPTITDTLAEALSERLTDVCVQHGWSLINVSVLPDRVEALVMGVEPSGETGEAVATALDEAMYESQPPFRQCLQRGTAMTSPMKLGQGRYPRDSGFSSRRPSQRRVQPLLGWLRASCYPGGVLVASAIL